ncbi:ninein [Hyalella azteca]|uniref:Ninein n=1 Tax=Hyalella azteca TaxID=294128 RepID=A0A979FV48_HYAAZ|nr:ninein [Hyalella azteca]
MGCTSSLPEQDYTAESKPSAVHSSSDRRSSTSSSKSPSSSSAFGDFLELPSKSRKRKITPQAEDQNFPRISSTDTEFLETKARELEEERRRVQAELERIRRGKATMGVVNSSLQGTRVSSSNNNNVSKEIAIDRHTLESYLRLEKEIAFEETTNPLQPLELKSLQLQQLNEEIENKEKLLKELEAKTTKERSEVEELQNGGKDVKSTLLEMRPSIDLQLTEEQGEYLAALNKQEMTEQELNACRKQKQQLHDEVIELERKAEKLQELYKQQDQLLDKMFGGEYGSNLENRLEQELDTLEAHRARILEANFKWRQAQMMLEYACKQLAVAVQKWQDLPTLPTIDLEIRYSVAAETRNNLVAAGQNLTGAQRYLDAVQFPYCAPDEVSTLNKQATEYVFTDMQSADRHAHAQACYSTSYKRANALLQWFDTVRAHQLDQIAQEHQKELQSFIREQEQKQQKIRGSLEEKLALRRQRRARLNLEQAQQSALASAE